MEKKNNSNILWIVIVVLVAIIALGIGWYLGGKNSGKTQEKAENEVKEQIKNDDEIFADVEKKMEYLYQMDQLSDNLGPIYVPLLLVLVLVQMVRARLLHVASHFSTPSFE